MFAGRNNVQAVVYYRRLLIEYFNIIELRNLCFELNIDYDDLPSEGKSGKARELVGYLFRRGRLQDLIDYGKQERPNATWDLAVDLARERLSTLGIISTSSLGELLSDRLAADPSLSDEFQSFKTNWYGISQLTVLPVLGKSLVEYCEFVDEIAGALIPSDWGIADTFILCCAIYLHKIGLFPNNNQRSSTSFDRYSKHSSDYIMEFGAELGLPNGYVEDIGWVCYGHRDFIDDDGELRDSLSDDALQKETKKGGKTRLELACFLRILSRLGAINARMPEIFSQLYFGNTQSNDYKETRMNSVLSGFKINLEDIEKSQILLEANLQNCGSLKEDLYFLKEIENTFKEDLSVCSRRLGYPSGDFFCNPTASLDPDSLTKALERCVYSKAFLSSIENSMQYALEGLLKSRNLNKDQPIKGWGPFIFVESGHYENFGSARVANTAEVLLSFVAWTLLQDHVTEEQNAQIQSTINEAISSLDQARIQNFPERRNSLEGELKRYQGLLTEAKGNEGIRIKKQIESLENTIRIEEECNPLTSLSFVVPTLRVNSLIVLAFSYLLEFMENYVDPTKNEILLVMEDCIRWMCQVETGVFSNRMTNDLDNEYIFQLILSLKALINSQNYWKQMNIEIYDQRFPKVVAAFVHSLNDKHIEDSNWPKLPFRGMALEVLIYYCSQSDKRIFRRQPQVKRLITDFVDELLDKIELEKFSLWEDKVEILRDEGRENPKDWTHVTSVWSIEGLCNCQLAGLLTKKQEKRFYQLLPLILLRQSSDGFFESVQELSGTRKSIFRTALYTFALTKVHQVISTAIST